MILFVVGTWATLVVARPLIGRRVVLVTAMIATFVAALLMPGTRRYFSLELPPAGAWPVIVTVAVSAVAGGELLLRCAPSWCRLQRDESASGLTATGR